MKIKAILLIMMILLLTSAYVNNNTGEIEYFVVEQPRKFYNVFSKENNVKKIYFKQIMAFGADVILIQLQ